MSPAIIPPNVFFVFADLDKFSKFCLKTRLTILDTYILVLVYDCSIKEIRLSYMVKKLCYNITSSLCSKKVKSLFKGIIIKPAIEPRTYADSCLTDANFFANRHPEIKDK